MERSRFKVGLVLMTGLLLVCLLVASCISARDFKTQLRSITGPYAFSIARWEFSALFGEARKTAAAGPKIEEGEVDKVIEYFNSVEQRKVLKSEIEAISTGTKSGDLAAFELKMDNMGQQNLDTAETVETIISRQLRGVLAEQGIFNPLDRYIGLKIGFPPLNFKLKKPPYLLVVSPRDRIESVRKITLRQNIGREEAEKIEAETDKLGVSSLVVELGGFAGTYPSLVTSEASLRFVIDAAAEEWLHQYLAFRPLGFSYLLDLTGLRRNYDIATMNETVASMVSKEIGAIAYEKYYADYQDGQAQSESAKSGFNFNQEMREIRQAVDSYLARGEIKQAEEFMEQKREYLASKGYYIRKLNQAYFAFHGTYADRPGSVNPIGAELRKLRAQSDSLKDFLNTVAAMSSRQQLAEKIK